MRRDRDPTETAFADGKANWGQNWNSSPAALRWSVAGLLDLNSRSQLRRNGGQMVTRHKNADETTKLARCGRRDTDSAEKVSPFVLGWSGGSAQ
jgi:hypothetical protein